MKRGKLTETQIVTMLNESEAGVPTADLCRQYKISSAALLQGQGEIFRNECIRA